MCFYTYGMVFMHHIAKSPSKILPALFQVHQLHQPPSMNRSSLTVMLDEFLPKQCNSSGCVAFGSPLPGIQENSQATSLQLLLLKFFQFPLQMSLGPSQACKPACETSAFCHNEQASKQARKQESLFHLLVTTVGEQSFYPAQKWTQHDKTIQNIHQHQCVIQPQSYLHPDLLQSFMAG